MKNLNLFVVSSLMFTLLFSACTSQKPSKQEETVIVETAKEYNASVFFQNLADGDTLSSPFSVEMGVEGMQVEAAGLINEGFGHHHIIINCTHIDEETTIPVDDQHIHYGAGQTETELELEAGTYCLTLQFANGSHQSYGEELSKTIKVVVQ
jgi:hypothetical protein